MLLLSEQCGAFACPQAPNAASGTPPDDLSRQLQPLLSSISHPGSTDREEMETDLLQTDYLLAAASNRLSKSLPRIHTALAGQRCMMGGLVGGQAPTALLRGALARLQEEASMQVTAAVIGLQFQDMTSQLIGRIPGHVGNLREPAVAVGSAGAALCSRNLLKVTALRSGVVVTFETFYRLFDKQYGLLRNDVRKPAAQTLMDSGDIALF